ncbi:MAG: chemotaxis protein [Rhodocyclaceae bacterium]|nr:chemotaxis protein [Rhodocyclaceae bacterium]
MHAMHFPDPGPAFAPASSTTVAGGHVQTCPQTELARITGVNEEIKGIVAIAFKINLMALNAIFLAKRAGAAARGFAVLSKELRSFAQELTQEMEQLRVMTAQSVTQVTAHVQQRRRSAIMQLAADRCTVSVGALSPVLARVRLALQTHQGRQLQIERSLRGVLEETGQRVEFGAALARAAKIEAAYGGLFCNALMQVSSEFGDVIAQIKASLERLARIGLGERRPARTSAFVQRSVQ